MADVLGFVATGLIVLSLMMSSLIWLRIVGLVGSATFTLYGVAIGAWPVVATNGVITTIHLLHLVRIFVAGRRSPIEARPPTPAGEPEDRALQDRARQEAAPEQQPSEEIARNHESEEAHPLGNGARRSTSSGSTVVGPTLPAPALDGLFAGLAQTAIETLSADFAAVVVTRPEARLVVAPSGRKLTASHDLVMGSLLQVVVGDDHPPPRTLAFDKRLVARRIVPFSIAEVTGAIVVAEENGAATVDYAPPELGAAFVIRSRA